MKGFLAYFSRKIAVSCSMILNHVVAAIARHACILALGVNSKCRNELNRKSQSIAWI